MLSDTNNEFEDLARSKANLFELQPSSRVLQSLHQKLHPQKRRRFLPFWWFGLPIIIAVGCYWYFQWPTNISTAKNTIAIATTISKKQDTLNVPKAINSKDLKSLDSAKTSKSLTLFVTKNGTSITRKSARKNVPNLTVHTTLTSTDLFQKNLVIPAEQMLPQTTPTVVTIEENIIPKNEVVSSSAGLDSAGATVKKDSTKPSKTGSRKWHHFIQAGTSFFQATSGTVSSNAAGSLASPALGTGITMSDAWFQQVPNFSAQIGWQVLHPISRQWAVATGANLQYVKYSQSITSFSNAVAANPSGVTQQKSTVESMFLQVPFLLTFQPDQPFLRHFSPIVGITNHMLLSNLSTQTKAVPSVPNWWVTGTMGVSFKWRKNTGWNTPNIQYQWHTQYLFPQTGANLLTGGTHQMLVTIPLNKK